MISNFKWFPYFNIMQNFVQNVQKPKNPLSWADFKEIPSKGGGVGCWIKSRAFGGGGRWCGRRRDVRLGHGGRWHFEFPLRAVANIGLHILIRNKTDHDKDFDNKADCNESVIIMLFQETTFRTWFATLSFTAQSRLFYRTEELRLKLLRSALVMTSAWWVGFCKFNLSNQLRTEVFCFFFAHCKRNFPIY